MALGGTHKRFLEQPSDRVHEINDSGTGDAWKLESPWDKRLGKAPPYLIRNYRGLPQRLHAVST